MATRHIREFTVNDNINGFFAVRRKTLREFARGHFVQLELGDCTGRINGVIWDPDQFALEELDAGMVIKLRGTVTEYQNKLQLTIKQVRLATEDEYTLEDILPHSPLPESERRAKLQRLVESIDNTFISQLTESFFADERFADAFVKAPAGKLWHHAYIGGLADHSANVAELALEVGSHYSFVSRDILIFGGLLHDMGKVEQYGVQVMIDYTDAGRLVGHINLADAWIVQRAAEIEAFPPELLLKLRHVILSHQGEYQFASPVVPQTPEAFIVYYCDEIDSKMGAISRIRDKQGGTGWSEYVKLMDRFLYFGKPDGE